METKKGTLNEIQKMSFLEEELDWLRNILETIRRKGTEEESKYSNIYDIPLSFLRDDCTYGKTVTNFGFGFEERLILILSLAPHLQPSLLDVFKLDKIPSCFGGIVGRGNAFIPTGETLMFILSENNVNKRAQLLRFFDKEHAFYKDNLVSLEEPLSGDPEVSGALIPSKDLIDIVLRGYIRKPDLRPDFPAKLLSTEMKWEDIVLPSATLNQLNEIELWLQHNQALANDNKIGKKIKPGFRALFYGPPGTGKTLSACLIGKKTGRDVYRVDLSTIVSKYIGETEKNLAKLFDRAERKDWILFFDEADALFGKRTNVSDSHDRYANQEVSYLLQRIEYHEGLVILATNMKNNMDSAFLRRFQSIVYFPSPKSEERLLLWQKAFSDSIPADKNIALADIAKKYELSGSLILNIVSHTTLKAINENSPVITNSMLMEGISRELAKEGRTV